MALRSRWFAGYAFNAFYHHIDRVRHVCISHCIQVAGAGSALPVRDRGAGTPLQPVELPLAGRRCAGEYAMLVVTSSGRIFLDMLLQAQLSSAFLDVTSSPLNFTSSETFLMHLLTQYLDVSDDLGACTEDAATTTISTSKPATAGPRSSSAQPHSALSSPIKPPSKATSGPPSGALSPGVRITTAAGSALPALQHTQAEAHEVLMTSVRRHAELHGAKVSGNLHNKVTHVVMRPEELSRAGKIKVSGCVVASNFMRIDHRK